MRQPLSPTTMRLYSNALARAFGEGRRPPFVVNETVLKWPESSKALLRAAVKRAYEAAKIDASNILADIPVEWAPNREVDSLSEEECQAYEAACDQLPPGRHALALLPLRTGLRSRELITLPRKNVERASLTGDLKVLRKGGKEQIIPGDHVKDLWDELLSVKSAKRTNLFESPLLEGRPWKVAGDILSTGKKGGAYVALYRLVQDVGDSAGVEDLHPHSLRHAFATRMLRDGAPLPAIQYALGHADITTTMKYVHPGVEDARKFVRRRF